MRMRIYTYFKVKKDDLLKFFQMVTDKTYGGFAH
jgi:hypothetical protein